MTNKIKYVPITKLAKTIRSKNAGVYHITFEILFDNKKNYELVKKSGIINKELFAKIYKLKPEAIVYFDYFDPGLAIKATINRSMPAGEPGDTDIFGCQQYSPLLDIQIPVIQKEVE